MTKRYGVFLGILAAAGILECLFTPLLSYLQTGSSFLTFPLYYLTRLLALALPFLTLGAIFSAFANFGFRRMFLYLLPFVLIDVVVQVPLSLLAYYDDLLSSFGLIFLGYSLTSLLSSALVFLLALLSYFVFFFRRDTLTTHDVFFTAKSNEGRAALLSASVATLYLLVTEIINIVEDATARLWILDGIDVLNYLFSLLFVALCGFVCYVSARAGGVLSEQEKGRVV